MEMGEKRQMEKKERERVESETDEKLIKGKGKKDVMGEVRRVRR
jgi:hypothetical protein